jgi:23S rRNA pseudouridine1911/1915/1917 synthase
MRDSREKLDIVYEDRVLLVVNKKAGVLTVPLARRRDAASVYEQVKQYLRPRRRRPFVVHRIDRDTSGLVVFAKDPRTQQRLKAQFERREAERLYWAVVHGCPNPPTGMWRDRLAWDRSALKQHKTGPRDPRGHEAVSEYRLLEELGPASLIEVRLITGKRNQIRIQAQLHGYSLVGEHQYASGASRPDRLWFPRQALHACRLTLRHPASGRPLRVEAPLPEDLAELVAGLRRRLQGAGAQ